MIETDLPFVREGKKDKIKLEDKESVLSELSKNGPVKPWTLKSRTNVPHKVIRIMTLNGDIMPTSDGDVKINRKKYNLDY